MIKLKIGQIFNKYLPMFFYFLGQIFATWQHTQKWVCKGTKRFFWKKLLNVTTF
jgi:hypothetical protein